MSMKSSKLMSEGHRIMVVVDLLVPRAARPVIVTVNIETGKYATHIATENQETWVAATPTLASEGTAAMQLRLRVDLGLCVAAASLGGHARRLINLIKIAQM